MTEQFVRPSAHGDIERNKRHLARRRESPQKDYLLPVRNDISLPPDEYRSLTDSERFVLRHPDWHESPAGRWAKKRLDRDPDYFRRSKSENDARLRERLGEDGYSEFRYAQRLKFTFGISLDQYLEMLADQAGGCAICGHAETATRKGRVKRLAVDHDHDTGRIRGLLCQKCNTLIGSAGENLDVLRRAIQYLSEGKV